MFFGREIMATVMDVEKEERTIIFQALSIIMSKFRIDNENTWTVVPLIKRLK